MSLLNQINLNEIKVIKHIFGISYDKQKQGFNLTKPLSEKDLIVLYEALSEVIWTPHNVSKVMEELRENPPERTRLYYFGPGYPVSIDGYLSKMGLLNYEILIEDPLCFPLSVKPSYHDHILQSPSLYLKHLFESAVFMVYVEEWIRKGYLSFVPSLPLFDTPAFWELSKIAKDLNARYHIDSSLRFQRSMDVSMAEGAVRLSLDMLRLTKNNYTTSHMKKIFPGCTEEEAKKYLDIFKSQTLEQREQVALDHALKMFNLSDKEKKWLHSQFLKSRPFNIERFLDVSVVNGSLFPSTGMPLLHATYISDQMQCIPSTDHPGLMGSYESWCEALGQGTSGDFESVRSKVELPFTFFEDVPLEFIQKAREKNKGIKASLYLEEEWQKIRTSQDLATYNKSAREFSQKVELNLQDLKKEQEILRDELHYDIRKTAALSVGAFVAGNIITEIPLAAATGILTAIASSIETIKTQRSQKHELQSKPLMVFLEAEAAAGE